MNKEKQVKDKDVFKEEILIRFSGGKVELIEEGIEGRKKKKISPHSLLKLIESNRIKDEFYRVGPLPKGYVDGAVGEESATIFLKTKSDIFPTFYYDEKTRFDVPFPHMLFVFEVTKERVQSTYVYALKEYGKEGYLDADTPIYLYPYGNVNSLGSRVCWGGNVLPPIKKIKDLERIPQIFINSIMNDDNYNDVNLSNMNLRDLLVSLNGKKKFDNNILKPANTTFGRLVDKYLNKNYYY